MQKRESPAAIAKRRKSAYFKSAETNRIHIPTVGFIDYTATFKYLGTLTSFDLKDDDDIQARVDKSSQQMGAFKNVWESPYVDLKAKYLFFLAIPINTLLWGCESWAIREDHHKKLDVFVHSSVRRILGINMLTVREERLRNEKVRKMLFNIPNARQMVAARQTSYLGKIIRHHNTDHIPKQLLTAWVNNPRPKRGVLFTNKKSLVNSLNMLYKPKDLDEDAPHPHLNKTGKLKQWYHDAQDEKYWEWKIDDTLRKSHLDKPPPSNENTPPPENADGGPPPSPPRRNQNNILPPPPRRRRRDQNENSRDFDPAGVGNNLTDSLKCLGLSLEATEREVRVNFRQLSRVYHPDKHKPEQTGLTQREAIEKFQLINNAYSYLVERM